MEQTTLHETKIDAAGLLLSANLALPADARGVVIFAHGSGSGRFSPRNRAVAATLNGDRFGTLLMDLLTEREEVEDRLTGRLRFDIPLLAKRLMGACDWARRELRPRSLPIGLFGASTGAAAAIIAAAERPGDVSAVVSRGGRPDLAGEALERLASPTLLIVGGDDEAVIGMNERAVKRIGQAKTQIEIVPGADHLFEEPGALDAVARLAADWFGAHFPTDIRSVER